MRPASGPWGAGGLAAAPTLGMPWPRAEGRAKVNRVNAIGSATTVEAPIGAATTEAELARRAVAGDGAAFAALYDRHERAVFNFCYRLTGSAEDAADAVQEAFVAVLERLPKLDPDELNFGAYLMTTARHGCYRSTERRGRAEPTDEIPEGAPMVAGGGGGLGMPDPGDPADDPERAALLVAQQEEIRGANARLPERQREALALRELHELSYDEIAEIMEMNRNSVAQLISRARINLRDELRGETLAAIAARTPECERALPLIAMRQDGQLRSEGGGAAGGPPDEADDAGWLTEHIRDCDTCALSVEAMEEAGTSYRAWLPLVPFAWLRMETIAKAAESVGADWSEVARERPDPSPNGSSPNGGVGVGGGGGGAILNGPAIALAGDRRPRVLSTRERAARRVGKVAVLTVVLLLTLVALVVGDGASDDEVASTKPAAGAAQPGATGGSDTDGGGSARDGDSNDGAAGGEAGDAGAADQTGARSGGSDGAGSGDEGRADSNGGSNESDGQTQSDSRQGGSQNGGGQPPSSGGGGTGDTPSTSVPIPGPTPPATTPTPPATSPPTDPPRTPPSTLPPRR